MSVCRLRVTWPSVLSKCSNRTLDPRFQCRRMMSLKKSIHLSAQQGSVSAPNRSLILLVYVGQKKLLIDLTSTI